MSNFKKIVLGFDEFSAQTLNEAKKQENKKTEQELEAEQHKKGMASKEPSDIRIKLPNGQVGVQTTLDLIEQTCGGRDWKAVKSFLKRTYPDTEVDDDFVSSYIDDMIRQTDIGRRSYTEEGPDSIMLLVLHLILISLLMFPKLQNDIKGKIYDGGVMAIINEKELN